MEQTREGERRENASCVKEANRLMRTNVLLNRVSPHQRHGKEGEEERTGTQKKEV
jgi:hypothetical protein